MPLASWPARTGLAALLSLPLAPTAAGEGMSPAYRAFYVTLEASLVADGRLRMDRGPAAVEPESLVRDFIDVAFYEEYAGGHLGRTMGTRAAKPLLRWEEPVGIRVVFGASVPETRRAEDRRAVRAYAERLARITGHPVATTSKDANFHVLVVNEDERRSLEGQLPRLIPGISSWMVRTILRMQKNHLCMVVAEPHPDPRRGYVRAVAILRAEHPGRLRQACLEEELAQGMGLPNDFDAAAPSIFSDSFDYAALTQRDELLLKMLYHPSLASGMTREQALPAITHLARSLAIR